MLVFLKRFARSNSFFWIGMGLFTLSCQKKTVEVDLLIEGALVFSGKNEPPRQQAVGICGERICYVGEMEDVEIKAKEKLWAEGLYLTPGFIDPHTHLDRDLSSEDQNAVLSALRQGVTTIIGGNDGGSPLPISRKLNEWERNGTGPNVALLVGHGTIRRMVMGMEKRAPTNSELKEMKQMVAGAMQEGAFGLSTGLFYAPGNFAGLDELIALAEVAHRYGGIYDSHIRDESSYSVGLIAAVKEVIAIGKHAGIPVHISHIKALGTDVWGQSKAVIDLIESAEEAGVIISANQYPYLASKTSLRATMIPRWAEDGGRKAFMKRLYSREIRARLLLDVKDNIRKRGGGEALVFSETANPELEGLSLKEFAEYRLLSEPEAVLTLLEEEDNVSVISYNMKEDDLKNFMLHPSVITGSDASSGHPRKFGSFVRKIIHFAQKLNWIEMHTAIYQSSGHTAEIFRIPNRGFIKMGNYADLVLFDPGKFKEMATFDQPYEEASGVQYLYINGECVINEGEHTGMITGKILRKEIRVE